MYCIQAVIATDPVLRELAAALPEACIVPLGRHLSLLPMTDALLAGLDKTSAGIGALIATRSTSGPVAYVVAEYFGGTGAQTAQVWDAGQMVLGPLHLAEGEPAPAAGTPIAQALRQLGVTKGSHFDEFDAVSLGRYRDTDDWLPPTS